MLCGLQTLVSKDVIASASEAISLLLLVLVAKDRLLRPSGARNDFSGVVGRLI